MKHDNIPGFPGYYISRWGRVFSRLQMIRGGHLGPGSHRIYTDTWKELKPYVKHRYGKIRLSDKPQVTLYKLNDRKPYVIKVHHLVAKVYVPNPNNLPIIRHLDDNGCNNYYKNLRWGTVKDNVHDAMSNHIKNGLKYADHLSKLSHKDENNSMWNVNRSPWDIDTRKLMAIDYLNGMKPKDIANKYGGTPKKVRSLFRNKSRFERITGVSLNT